MMAKVKVAAVGLMLIGGGLVLAAGATSAPSTSPTGQANTAATKGDGTGSAATLDARSLLKQVLVATSGRPPLYWKGEVEAGKDGEMDSRASITVFTAGAKVDAAADARNLATKRTWRERQIWNGEQYFLMNDDPETNQRVGIQGAAYGTSVHLRRREHVLGRWIAASFADGYIGGVDEAYDGYAAQLVSEATDVRLATQREAVEGVSCWRVDATTSLGKVKMWVDPSSGNLPKKIVIEKGPGDVLGEAKVVEGDSYTTEIIGHRMQQSDGVWMATDATATVTSYHDSKPYERFVMHARRTEVHVLPEAELERMGAFALGAAADGTAVSDLEGARVPYRFVGGKVEIVDEADAVPQKR